MTTRLKRSTSKKKASKSPRSAIRERLVDAFSCQMDDLGQEKLIFLDGDGFDEAILGIKEVGEHLCVFYSLAKLVKAIMTSDKVDYHTAMEHLGKNTIASVDYMGPGAPDFVDDTDLEE